MKIDLLRVNAGTHTYKVDESNIRMTEDVIVGSFTINESTYAKDIARSWCVGDSILIRGAFTRGVTETLRFWVHRGKLKFSEPSDIPKRSMKFHCMWTVRSGYKSDLSVEDLLQEAIGFFE